MATEKRLIDRNEIFPNGTFFVSAENPMKSLDELIARIWSIPTVDAAPVVHGWWRGYVHSALVRWKDGEPVWADRNVYRCSRCDFGTIAKHNYCPRCGAKMDGERKDNG